MVKFRPITLLLFIGLIPACGPTSPGVPDCDATFRHSPTEPVRPGTAIQLDGILENSRLIEAWHGDSEVIAGISGDGDFVFVAPFYNSDLYASGSIEVDFIVDGEPCGTVFLDVTGLPNGEEPGVAGSFERIVTESVTNLDGLLAEVGLERGELAAADAGGVSLYPILYALDLLVRGDDNPNSLVNILSRGSVEVEGELVPFDIGLLDAVVSWNAEITESSETSLEPAALPPAHLYVSARTPAGLFELMRQQYFAENTLAPKTETALQLTAAVGLVAIIAAGPLSPVVFAVTAANIALVAYKWFSVERQVNLLPNSVDLTFEVSADVLNEDGSGVWRNVELQPSNLGVNNVFEGLTAVLLSAVPALTGTDSTIKSLVASLVSTVLDHVNSKITWSSESPRPYDWSALYIPASQASTWLESRHTGSIRQGNELLSYEGSGVGSGAVVLAIRPGLVDGRDFSFQVQVEVLEIEVMLFPDEPQVLGPGDTGCFAALVRNADDPSYRWVTPEGISETDTACWTAPQQEVLEVLCDGLDKYTYAITAESLAATGARKPAYSPPPRSAVGLLIVNCPEDTGGIYTGTLEVEIDIFTEFTYHINPPITANGGRYTQLLNARVPVIVDTTDGLQIFVTELEPGNHAFNRFVLREFYSRSTSACHPDSRSTSDQLQQSTATVPKNGTNMGITLPLLGGERILRLFAVVDLHRYGKIETPCYFDEAEETLEEVQTFVNMSVPDNWLAGCEEACIGLYDALLPHYETGDPAAPCEIILGQVSVATCESTQVRELRWDLRRVSQP